MNKSIVFASVLLLAGCSKTAETDEVPAATEAAATPVAVASAAGPQPGKYDVVMPDGKTGTTEIMADGSYSDMADGKVTEKGKMAMRDGKTCFTPDGGKESCFTDSAPAADGSFTATNAKGEIYKVKPAAK